MPRTAGRAFNHIDFAYLLIIAILALLVAYSADRVDSAIIESNLIHDHSWRRWPLWVYHLTRSASRLRADFLAFLGVSSLFLGVNRIRLAVKSFWPRRMHHTRSEPGHIALFVAALLTLFWVLMEALTRWIMPLIRPAPGRSVSFLPLFEKLTYEIWLMLSPPIAWAITAAWITLAFTGGWRSSIDWTDRLGRWVGWAWLGAYLVGGLLEAIALR